MRSSGALGGPAGSANRDAMPVAGVPLAAADSADGRNVAILVLYSRVLAELWGSRAYAVAYAHHAVDSLNTTLKNSHVDGWAFLAGLEHWDHPGPAQEDPADVLGAARQDATVKGLRDELHADLVAVMADALAVGPRATGVAYLLSKSVPPEVHVQYAYSVTKVDGDSFNHIIWLHEIGHNLGGQHPPGSDTLPPDQAFAPYAYAYGRTGFYSALAGGDFVHLLYSNSRVRIDGLPTGVPNEQDNARVFQQTIPIVAGYRLGGSEVPRNNLPPPIPPPPTVTVSPPIELRAMRTLGDLGPSALAGHERRRSRPAGGAARRRR